MNEKFSKGGHLCLEVNQIDLHFFISFIKGAPLCLQTIVA